MQKKINNKKTDVKKTKTKPKKQPAKIPEKIGRPTKYDESLCEEIIEMMSQGKSIIQVAANFNISRDTLYEWEKIHKEFSDSLSIGRAKAEAYWEDKLQEIAEQKNAITNGNLALILKSRYRWSEKQEIGLTGDLSVDDVTNLSPEERRKRIAEFIDKTK